MSKYQNKIVTNRKSPKNENDYIIVYKQENKKANKPDGYDVSAVRAKDGTPGHAMVKEEYNRSKDRDHHIGKDFIPDYEIKKENQKINHI